MEKELFIQLTQNDKGFDMIFFTTDQNHDFLVLMGFQEYFSELCHLDGQKVKITIEKVEEY